MPQAPDANLPAPAAGAQPADGPRFGRGRSLLYASQIDAAFFGAAEGLLRLIGVDLPKPRPRLLLRAMDVDIDFPFMRADPDLFWSPQPGFRGEFLGQPVTINALGLRGAEVALPKPAGRRRVVCLGDSITFGYGVGDGQSYPARLGAALDARGVEVVDGGVTGFTSHQVLGLSRRLAPRIQADVVTLLIGWNDLTRRPLTDREFARRLAAGQAVEGALDRLYLFRAMKAAYLRSLRRLPPDARRTERVPAGDYAANLRAIVAEWRGHGARPVFLALPRRRRPGEPPFHTDYAGVLRRAAGELSVPLVELGDLGLATGAERNDAYFIDLLHFSPAGNERMAGILAGRLAELGWL